MIQALFKDVEFHHLKLQLLETPVFDLNCLNSSSIDATLLYHYHGQVIVIPSVSQHLKLQLKVESMFVLKLGIFEQCHSHQSILSI